MTVTYVSGSPPPARGAQVALLGGLVVERITPACAGSTCLVVVWHSDPWDHPRLRGEHREFLTWPEPQYGSPPPARGAPRN